MSKTVPHWNFLSNYAHILICLAEDPRARMRDVAERVGITERAAMRIVSQLEAADILTRYKEGRRNRYDIHEEQPLRHPLEAHCSVGSLLSLLLSRPKAKRASSAGKAIAKKKTASRRS